MNSGYCRCFWQADDWPNWRFDFAVLAKVGGVASAILSDQVKSLDWKLRNAKKKATVSAEVMKHVRAKIKALLMLG